MAALVPADAAVQAASNRSYTIRAAGSRAAGSKPPVGRSEAKTPTASGPSSPAKSGSHSAIVEPISAPTCRPAASIARRNAIPSGMCEARMTTSGRRRAQLAHDAVPVGGERGCTWSRTTTGTPSAAACPAAASATDIAYASDADTIARRSVARGAPEPGGELGRREGGRVGAQVRAAGPDPEDASAARGRSGGRRPHRPPSRRARRRRRPRSRRSTGRRHRTPTTTLAPSAAIDRITAGASCPLSSSCTPQLDRPPADAAVGIDQVGRDPEPLQLVAGKATGRTGEREDRPDRDRRAAGVRRWRAAAAATTTTTRVAASTTSGQRRRVEPRHAGVLT